MLSRQSRLQSRLWAYLCGLLLASTASLGADASATAEPASSRWVASWGSAQQIPELHNELPAAQWRDASLRQIVHTSLGGQQLRVRISNAFGSTGLVVEAASVARAVAPGKADIAEGTARALTFSGKARVMIPAGAEYYSDPLALEHPPGADLAVSLHFKGEPVRQTGHPGSRATSFVTPGNRVTDTAWPQASKVVHWYQLSDIEVLAPAHVGVVVAMGDSITDGNGSTTDGNDRWPDLLAARLREAGTPMGVVNAGIGGGRMLRDGLGPNMAARWDRDVLARSGITHAVVLIGVNDLGGQHRNGDDSPEARQAMLDDLMNAHRQLVQRAHAQGICVIGATMTAYMGSDYYRPNADNEADRQALNAWIRNSGTFDAVADFDAATRDAAQAHQLSKEADSGDRLHPSPAGFRAMAQAVPLAALQKRCTAKL
ncbi:MAG: GDSL family lipase [Comamonadaceae bacterium PBBC2]|nr:MAG: GDSL family lipase [Comamonadaceae bacterium PBBC2]